DKFGEAGLIEDRDLLPRGVMFGGVIGKPVLAAERVFHIWFFRVAADVRRWILIDRSFIRLVTSAATAAGEPVRALPSILCAKAGAARGEPVVQRSFAQAAPGFKFAVRPGHLVMQSENLRDALAQEGAAVRPRSEPANVHR